MKIFRLFLILTATFLLVSSETFAQENPAPAPTISSEFVPLNGRIMTKLRAGQRSAADLAAEVADFDALIAKYHDQKTDEVAEVVFMRAMLDIQVFEDLAKGRELLGALKQDFPETKRGQQVSRILEQLDQQAKAEAAKTALIGQPAPELHFTWSTREGLKTLSELKGKVVVLDFWATWCGPCIRSFPEVAEAVAHYEGCDVVVVGVTSLQGRVMNLETAPIDCQGDAAKETGLMPAFIKKHNMTWTVAMSSEEVFNPDYGVTGIPHMTIIAPDGIVRHNGIHPAIPLAEKTGMIDAILQEFKLKLPAKG